MNTGELIKSICEGLLIDTDESESLFNAIFNGELSEVQLAAVLIAMKTRRESAREIIGAARSMRRFMLKPDIEQEDLFDTCGTGGDKSYSFNISTAVAIILNAMGYGIAKHGNRSVSSNCGSADFLEALKIPIALGPEDAGAYFSKHQFIFLFAPNFHPAMKYAAPVRKALGVRTIFNFLGPLTNPASTKRQMIGVFHPDMLGLYAEAAIQLGYERAVIYSAEGGMDEISPNSPTQVYDINGKNINRFTIMPAAYISPQEAAAIPSHQSAGDNAVLFMQTISEKKSTPLAKLLALNAALALSALEDSGDIGAHFKTALDVILSGQVAQKVAYLREGE